MKLVTKQDRLNGVLENWERQYFGDRREWHGDKEEIYKKIKALKNPIQEAIDEIIGNGSWTKLECDECEDDCPAVMLFKRWDHAHALCYDCLDDALKEL